MFFAYCSVSFVLVTCAVSRHVIPPCAEYTPLIVCLPILSELSCPVHACIGPRNIAFVQVFRTSDCVAQHKCTEKRDTIKREYRTGVRTGVRIYCCTDLDPIEATTTEFYSALESAPPSSTALSTPLSS